MKEGGYFQLIASELLSPRLVGFMGLASSGVITAGTFLWWGRVSHNSEDGAGLSML